MCTNLLWSDLVVSPERAPSRPQLLHLYPAEEILVGQGITPDEVEDIFVEA